MLGQFPLINTGLVKNMQALKEIHGLCWLHIFHTDRAANLDIDADVCRSADHILRNSLKFKNYLQICPVEAIAIANANKSPRSEDFASLVHLFDKLKSQVHGSVVEINATSLVNYSYKNYKWKPV